MTRWPGDSSILSAVGQLMQTVDDTDVKEYIFYFAGRPIAQLSWFSGGTLEWRAYTVDHLGTPIYAADETGTEVWQGGFEPFGAD